MGSDRYLPFVPIILEWMQRTLDVHAGEKRSVASLKFARLPRYFSAELLTSASVVVVDRLPVPPLSAMGLPEFASFENQPTSGITYLDTYFIEPSAATNESAHFHELIHVVQWQVLGPQNFLLLYAAGLAEHGYLGCPLEAMAYGHQRRFDVHWPSYSAEEKVQRQTLPLLASQAYDLN